MASSCLFALWGYVDRVDLLDSFVNDSHFLLGVESQARCLRSVAAVRCSAGAAECKAVSASGTKTEASRVTQLDRPLPLPQHAMTVRPVDRELNRWNAYKVRLSLSSFTEQSSQRI